MRIFDAFTPIGFRDLFTMMWAGALLIVIGSIFVYTAAQRRYRRYPAILALHEWVFWSILVTWGLVPLLVVIHVPLALLLLIVLPGMGIAAWATFFKFPREIAAMNDEIRRQRFVPPPRRVERERARPTPAGRRRRHR
ncbi:MAG TPA: hypothetical protein VFL75_10800 [Candidatus Limnocylindria bacterium]|jgi:hypothetical protein|nr:hypothetical protein [Candidatus Limnocylindria bacterium]